jgi:arylsulfatase A-like enzyme
MDEKIGNVLRKLDELKLRDNTIIIFQSDHGFSKEERTFSGGGSAGALRGSKFSLFEGGVRVPAMISWPGHIPANEVRDQVAVNIDWLPTLADYCRLPLPARKIDGQSLVDVISNARAQTPHPTLYWQSQGTKENPQWSVIEGDWKLLHSPYEAKQEELNGESLMLINLKDDPTEQRNVIHEHADIAAQLLAKYKTWSGEVADQNAR